MKAMKASTVNLPGMKKRQRKVKANLSARRKRMAKAKTLKILLLR
jgi:hypothetical protein